MRSIGSGRFSAFLPTITIAPRALLVDGRIVAAAQEERFTRKRHDRVVSDPCLPVRPRGGGHRLRGAVGGRFLRQAVPEVRAAARDLPRVRAQRLAQLLVRDAGLDQGEAVHAAARGAPGRARRRAAPDLLSRAPPVARGQRVLSVAVRRRGDSSPSTASASGRRRRSGAAAGRTSRFSASCTSRTRSGCSTRRSPTTLGFAVNSGEYKLMGLAPYGNPTLSAARGLHAADHVGAGGHSRRTGRSLLNMEYFDFATGLRMVNEAKWERLFGVPRRTPESRADQALHGHGAGHPAGDRGDRPAARVHGARR